jgi:hypothetical protein
MTLRTRLVKANRHTVELFRAYTGLARSLNDENTVRLLIRRLGLLRVFNDTVSASTVSYYPSITGDKSG